jgi:predicted nucleotidyltransferase
VVSAQESEERPEAGREAGKGGEDKWIAQMVERIVRHFDPEKIILFGSRARGDAGADSDVDLLVVLPYTGSPRELRLAIRRLLADIPLPKDVVVTSPEEFSWRQHVVGTLEYPAAREGKLLYDRSTKGYSGCPGMDPEGRE